MQTPVTRLDDGSLDPCGIRASQRVGPARGDIGPQVLNLDVFRSLLEFLDPSVLTQTYREFLLQTRAKIHFLKGGVSLAETHDVAHALRGTAGMVGADEIAAIAGGLEEEPTSGAPLVVLLECLHGSCTRLEAALRKEQLSL